MEAKFWITGAAVAAVIFFANQNTDLLQPAPDQDLPAVYADPKSEKLRQWELPGELNEVSGIAWISKDLFACVQDEDGTIFIFDTKDQEVKKRITFAGPGDYEGIALNGSTVYIVRSDGMIYEVRDYNTKPSVKQFSTPFTIENNIEGLTYDPKQDMLLLAVKDKDLARPGSKGVYAFALKDMKLNTTPLFSIDVSDPLLRAGKKKKEVRPSAIAIHPESHHYYVVDGPSSRLLQLDPEGKLVEVKDLGNDFAKPEGITFDPGGRMFISNERGKKSTANIIEMASE